MRGLVEEDAHLVGRTGDDILECRLADRHGGALRLRVGGPSQSEGHVLDGDALQAVLRPRRRDLRIESAQTVAEIRARAGSERVDQLLAGVRLRRLVADHEAQLARIAFDAIGDDEEAGDADGGR
jgi:hypothetical protein